MRNSNLSDGERDSNKGWFIYKFSNVQLPISHMDGPQLAYP